MASIVDCSDESSLELRNASHESDSASAENLIKLAAKYKNQQDQSASKKPKHHSRDSKLERGTQTVEDKAISKFKQSFNRYTGWL